MATEKYFVHKEDGSLVRLKGRLVRFLDQEPPTGSDKSAIRTALEVSPDAEGLVQADVGTDPNEIPVNGMLGDLAYQSSEAVSIDQLEVTDKVDGSLGVGVAPSTTVHLKSADPVIRLEDSSPDGVYGQIDGAGGSLILTADGGNGAGSSAIKLRVDGATSASDKVTIDSTGVGIGTSSPSYPLTVAKTGDGTKVDITNTVDTNLRVGINSGAAQIGPSTSSNLELQTGNTTRATIDSSGRLGVGQSTPGSYHVSADDLVVGDASGSRGLTISGSTTSSGSIFFADGTSGNEAYRGFVQYGHSADSLYLGTAGSTQWVLNSSGDFVSQGGGIDFGSTNSTSGVTVSSSVLDHYEAGLWTPVVADAVSGGNTATVGTAQGRYTRVGRIVQFSCLVANIDTTGLTAGYGLYIQGLPFPGVAVSSWKPMTVMMDTITFSGQVVGIIGQNESAIRFKQFSSGAADSDVLVSAVASSNADIHVQGVYEVV